MMRPTQSDAMLAEVTPAGSRRTWLKRSRWIMPLVILAGVVAFTFIKLEQPNSLRESFQVSQRGREFRPGSLNVTQGDVVRIVNDDGDLSHHAYIASERFKFDSGDQEPGEHADITFTKAGTFNVLCGIHPKMRLIVNVE